MSAISTILKHPGLRPLLLLVVVVAIFTVLHGDRGFLNSATAFSAFQHFATFGLVALALGMTMIMREFDISVAGMMGLGGCVAVLTGGDSALVGVLVAVGIGLAGGLIQGGIIVRMGLPSVAVSLGGLLTFSGIAYVITGNRTIPFENIDVALAINAPLFDTISLRALVVLGLFVVAALIVALTRAGRDIIAAGGNRHASEVAGTRPDRLLVGVFGASGALSALSGAMLSYGLLSASPSGGVSDILVPSVTAAILGGVSLSGGVGRPLGIAIGVLILAVLRTGLTSLGVQPYVHDVVTGGILLIVAIADGPHLRMRLFQAGRLFRPSPTAPHTKD